MKKIQPAECHRANYKYQLQDVKEPNLYRELYDYESIPKVAFNNRVSADADAGRNQWIADHHVPRRPAVTSRPFTVEQIVHLYKLLSRLGGPTGRCPGRARSLSTPIKTSQAVRECQELADSNIPEITSWIRANEKDFALVREMGSKETGILVSCSDYHIFKKMNMTRRQAMDKYLGIVKSALDTA